MYLNRHIPKARHNEDEKTMFVPSEIVDMIIDSAEYWPSIENHLEQIPVFVRQDNDKILVHTSPLCYDEKVSTLHCYAISIPILWIYSFPERFTYPTLWFLRNYAKTLLQPGLSIIARKTHAARYISVSRPATKAGLATKQTMTTHTRDHIPGMKWKSFRKPLT